jgi:hypothetical protein
MPSEPGLHHFEDCYRAAGRDPTTLPWANQAPHPAVVGWLDRHAGDPGRAIVVACGLGDDAEAVAGRGWDVTAFDISPTAIEWCRDRFPASTVDYRMADLLDLPPEWPGSFDLVVEVWTVQSLPYDRQPEAMLHIAGLITPGGTLLLASIVRAEASGPVAGPPWPPSREELALVGRSGLDPVATEDAASAWPGFDLVTTEYRRPI